MTKVKFKFGESDRVTTKLKHRGVVAMLGVECGTRMYMVSADNGSRLWWKECELKKGWKTWSDTADDIAKTG